MNTYRDKVTMQDFVELDCVKIADQLTDECKQHVFNGRGTDEEELEYERNDSYDTQ